MQSKVFLRAGAAQGRGCARRAGPVEGGSRHAAAGAAPAGGRAGGQGSFRGASWGGRLGGRRRLLAGRLVCHLPGVPPSEEIYYA